ncbi:hypothetical protein PoB_004570400 [Plakobranchus ocellatus]|uniref:Uncharacterized protein n=1 Tax=Plakobranchus ocellatus TaxID=259542 RepID=A0AAV4BLK9_9GAST|nr:hypothetical protein PoB_004570400 [Plakobranchus ocellatus]
MEIRGNSGAPLRYHCWVRTMLMVTLLEGPHVLLVDSLDIDGYSYYQSWIRMILLVGLHDTTGRSSWYNWWVCIALLVGTIGATAGSA